MRQRKLVKLASSILASAVVVLAARPAAGQGFGSSGMSSGLGSSGGGFGGSSSGGGFLGGSSSGGLGGLGGSSSSGGGFGGSTSSSRSGTGTGTGTSSNNMVVPQQSDILQGYYYSIYKLGVATNQSANTSGLGSSGTTTGATGSSTTSQGGFGQPMYGATKTPTTTTIGGSSGATSTTTGFNTVGTMRAPAYTTTLGYTFQQARPVISPGGMQIQLSDVFQRSTMLPGKDLQVVVDGPTVVLRGQVADENQRRLAEGMVRLEPGVREVRNEIRIAAPAPALSASRP